MVDVYVRQCNFFFLNLAGWLGRKSCSITSKLTTNDKPLTLCGQVSNKHFFQFHHLQFYNFRFTTHHQQAVLTNTIHLEIISQKPNSKLLVPIIFLCSISINPACLDNWEFQYMTNVLIIWMKVAVLWQRFNITE